MSNNIGSMPPKPPSLEKRLPLALALMMLVLLVSQYLFKPAPGPKPASHVDKQEIAKLTQKPTPTNVPEVATPVSSASGRITAPEEVTTDIDTALYHIAFTNRGAVVKSWVLKRYRDDTGKPLELINSAAKDVPLPFAIEVKNQKLSADPDSVLYQPKQSEDGLSLQYEFSDGNTTVRKSFTFRPDSYLADIKS